MGIVNFRCADTEKLFTTGRCKRFVSIRAAAERKLAQLEAAVSLESLRAPPGNRLEALQGSRASQHSIRINDQWRLCFVWTAQGPSEVEIVDYH
jgi:proteic killer suppression protein